MIKKPTLNYKNEKNSWNYYPSYQEYVDLMTSLQFFSRYFISYLGTLNSGREILIVQISDNVGVKENEPSFLYTSSMVMNYLDMF